MKKTVSLYVLLVLAAVLQTTFFKGFPWMPDLMILLVVFSGMFRGVAEAMIFAFIAAFMRGSLSFGTLGTDIFIFPLIGAMGFFEGRIFYRYNPIAQAMVTAIAVCVVLAAHILIFNRVYGNDASVLKELLMSWRTLSATVACAPICFFILSRELGLEDKRAGL
ncbi:MAG: rod shape-determining protein MreD [Candidatus Omnitrophota bacterium]|nr:rod shape-determining protein MreD [Candidatus Omnitrophota bacterium]